MLLDINEACVLESAKRLERDYPGLRVDGIVGDFTRALAVPPSDRARLALFFAGTIGNLHPTDVPGFLRRVAAVLAPGDGFLVGVDLVKDPARLHAAYNDAAGVTARFNLNVLQVLDDRLGADFDLGDFEHVAFYEERLERIEMRLRARRDVRVRIPGAGLDLAFAAGDEISTEISCKYTRRSFSACVALTGLAVEAWYSDPERLFALALLRR